MTPKPSFLRLQYGTSPMHLCSSKRTLGDALWHCLILYMRRDKPSQSYWHLLGISSGLFFLHVLSACMCPLTIWKAVNACPLDLSEGPQLLKAPTLPWSAGQCYLYLLISHRYKASSTDWLGVRHQQQWMVCSGPVTGRVGGKREGMTRLYFPSVLLSHRKPNQVGRQSQQNMIRIEEA